MPRKNIPDAKNRILKSALKIFAEKSFEGSRVDDISADARVPKSLIYYHFKSKDEIYETLIRNFLAEFAAIAQKSSAESGTETAGKISDRLQHRYFKFASRNSDLIRILLLDSLKKSTGEPALYRILEQMARLDKMDEHSSGRNEHLIAEFFTNVLPNCAVLCYSDSFTEHFKINRKEFGVLYTNVMQITHGAYHQYKDHAEKGVIKMQKTSPEKLAAIREVLRKNSSVQKSPEQLRREGEEAAARLPKLPGVIIEKTKIAGLNAEWVIPENAVPDSGTTVLYIHGGAFVSGSCTSYQDFASRVALAANAKVMTFEYRLAPEHPYPAANEDCLKVYRSLAGSSTQPDHIVLSGDSVGAYLVLMTLLTLRNQAAPLPKAAFLLSPHTDFLYWDGDSYRTNQDCDPINSLESIQRFPRDYFGADVRSPAILSPLNENLKGLPPLFIQTGGDEVILSDSTRLCERAKAAGVDAKLEVWEDMWHIFRFMAYMLPEGQEAILHIGDFIKSQFCEH